MGKNNHKATPTKNGYSISMNFMDDFIDELYESESAKRGRKGCYGEYLQENNLVFIPSKDSVSVYFKQEELSNTEFVNTVLDGDRIYIIPTNRKCDSKILRESDHSPRYFLPQSIVKKLEKENPNFKKKVYSLRVHISTRNGRKVWYANINNPIGRIEDLI